MGTVPHSAYYGADLIGPLNSVLLQPVQGIESVAGKRANQLHIPLIVAGIDALEGVPLRCVKEHGVAGNFVLIPLFLYLGFQLGMRFADILVGQDFVHGRSERICHGNIFLSLWVIGIESTAAAEGVAA